MMAKILRDNEGSRDAVCELICALSFVFLGLIPINARLSVRKKTESADGSAASEAQKEVPEALSGPKSRRERSPAMTATMKRRALKPEKAKASVRRTRQESSQA
jgi:hypothetical protein